MKLNVNQLPCDETLFLQKLTSYQAEMEAAKATVGVAAPFPEYEVMRTIVDSKEPLVVEHDVLQNQAKQVGRDALAELDALKARVTALETVSPPPPTK